MPTATSGRTDTSAATRGLGSHRVTLSISLLAALALAGCGGAPKKETAQTVDIADAVPKVEPKARYGNMDTYVVFGRRYYTKSTSRNHVERGIASWYGTKFHGRKTSSGEIYDMHQMTAAHKTLPLPTYARVTNLENGRSAVVRINDRGPFVGDRVIDLSYAAAKKLDVVRNGTAQVEVVSVDPRDHGPQRAARLVAASAPTPGESPASMRARSERAVAAPASPSGTEHRVATRDSTAKKPVAAITLVDADVSANRRLPETRSVALRGTTPAQDRPETSVSASAISPAVYLQVGAFGDRRNAEQLRTRLLGQLAEPILVREPDDDSIAAQFYKVHVGPIDSRARAVTLGRELTALGISSSMVVNQ
jgi:rare lipoprotein A